MQAQVQDNTFLQVLLNPDLFRQWHQQERLVLRQPTGQDAKFPGHVFVHFGSLASCLRDLLQRLRQFLAARGKEVPVLNLPDDRTLRYQWSKHESAVHVTWRTRFWPGSKEKQPTSCGYLLGQNALASPTWAEDLSALMRDTISPIKHGELLHAPTMCLCSGSWWHHPLVQAWTRQSTAHLRIAVYRKPMEAGAHAAAAAGGVHWLRAGGRRWWWW